MALKNFLLRFAKKEESLFTFINFNPPKRQILRIELKSQKLQKKYKVDCHDFATQNLAMMICLDSIPPFA